MNRRAWAVIVAWLVPALARAQDTTHAAAPPGVRVGITYTPGTRPSLTVLPLAGAGLALDSAAAILKRDLDYSDRFDMMQPPASVAMQGGAPNYAALTALGTTFAVAIAPAPAVAGADGTEIAVELHDVRQGIVRNRMVLRLPGTAGSEALRQAVHRAADEVVRWVTGVPGIAATTILYTADGHLWRVDPDGAGRTLVPAAGLPALSPAWSPDGRTIAYTAFVRSGQPIVLQDLATGARQVLPGTDRGLNITPEFSPDGKLLAYAHGDENGTDLYVYNLARHCCLTRLTVGRYYDNLSPAWSPDGQRIAFISSRAGVPQLYVMAPDGSGQELLASFDFGATGQTNGPEWSPDGLSVAFHRDVGGTPQVFVLDVASRTVRQITGEGRNEDPTWAPDSRHLAFVSTRGGLRELWIVDLETGRMRPLTGTVDAGLPAWSPRHTFFSEAG
jgi:TolB protein